MDNNKDLERLEAYLNTKRGLFKYSGCDTLVINNKTGKVTVGESMDKKTEKDIDYEKQKANNQKLREENNKQVIKKYKLRNPRNGSKTMVVEEDKKVVINLSEEREAREKTNKK